MENVDARLAKFKIEKLDPHLVVPNTDISLPA
jgi:hypothetical protein